MTIAEAYERLVKKDFQPNRKTDATNQSHCRRWGRLSPVDDTRKLTAETFAQFRVAARHSGYAPDTIEGTVSFVRSILVHLHRLGIVDTIPWTGRPLSKRSCPRWVPTLDDLGMCYASTSVATWPRNADIFWKAWFCIGYFTGLRLSDMLRLRFDHVQQHAIVMPAEKTGKVHVFPRHPVLDRHLEFLRRADRTGRVFDVGKCNHQILRELHRISEAGKVTPAITSHPLRRLSATEWQGAKWGAGEVIQGSAIRGSARFYIVPKILQDAVDSLPWPSQMQTDKERRDTERSEIKMLKIFRKLNSSGKLAVTSLAEKLIS